MSEKQFIIKRNFWDSKARRLTLSPDHIEFEDKAVGEDKPVRLLKEQIKEFRYGVVWLRGFYFYVGRQYQIFVRTHEGEELKIDFLTYYGFRKKELNATYTGVLNTMLDLYFDDISQEFLNTFYAGEAIELCGLRIHDAGVTIQSKGLLKTTVHDIPWEQVKTRRYRTYYAVYSSANAADINKSYKYLDDYNAHVLLAVLDTIVKHKQESN